MHADAISNFNSIKVRLERPPRPCPRPLFQDFNSIKVRLEQAGYLLNAAILVFQFHKGAIRTDSPDGGRVCSSVFQFHKGAIRTLLLRNGRRLHLDFNSIKMRLEHGTDQRGPSRS